MAPNDRVASLLRRAERPLATRDDDAALVSGLGEALGRNQLDASSLRSLRLAIADHEPRDEAHAASLRALRDVLRAAEAARIDVERQREVEGLLAHPVKGAILRALGAACQGPSDLARTLHLDQGLVSRALRDLEVADLVCPVENRQDGRARPRELTARGHRALQRAGVGAPSEGASVRAVVEVTVRVLADVHAQDRVRREDLERLARRHDVSAALASEVVAAVARAAERSGLIDDEEEGGDVRWGSVHASHRRLVEHVGRDPRRWDQEVTRVLGDGAFIVVVTDVDAWCRALREASRRPEDIVRPGVLLSDHPHPRIVDDRSRARILEPEGPITIAARPTEDSFVLEAA